MSMSVLLLTSGLALVHSHTNNRFMSVTDKVRESYGDYIKMFLSTFSSKRE